MVTNTQSKLSRNIIAVLIVVSLLPIATTVFNYVAGLEFDYQSLSSELCLMDLRKILLLAYDMEIGDQYLSFTYQNNEN